MVNKDVYGDNGEFNNLLVLITTIPTLTITRQEIPNLQGTI